MFVCVLGRAREWMICEGFQLILKLQAEALVDLGVCPQLKVSESDADNVDVRKVEISHVILNEVCLTDGCVMDFLEAIHAEDQAGVHEKPSEHSQRFSGEFETTQVLHLSSCVVDLG